MTSCYRAGCFTSISASDSEALGRRGSHHSLMRKPKPSKGKGLRSGGGQLRAQGGNSGLRVDCPPRRVVWALGPGDVSSCGVALKAAPRSCWLAGEHTVLKEVHEAAATSETWVPLLSRAGCCRERTPFIARPQSQTETSQALAGCAQVADGLQSNYSS